MPVAYISNKVPTRDYSFFDRDGLTPATVTFGSRLDLEEIARMLSVSEPTDILVLDGSNLISSVCLAMWLERHGRCCVYSPVIDQYPSWTSNLIISNSLRRFIENVHDEVTNGRTK